MRFKSEKEGGVLKPAFFKHDYTFDQAIEYAKCAADPIYFIETYCYIVHPVLGRKLFVLYEFQRRLIRHYNTHQKTISLIARQSGKTETAAAFLLWWAIFKPDQRILITSFKGDSAKLILKRLKFMYEQCPWWLKPGVYLPGGWNVLSVQFDNGSTLNCETTTGNTGRGQPNSLIYCDELAYVRPNVAADFWTSVLPSINTGGRCIITSTANTDEDKFAQIWLSSTESSYSDPWLDVNTQRHMDENADDEIVEETIFEDESMRDDEETKEKGDQSIAGFVRFHAKWWQVPDRNIPSKEEWRRKQLASGTKQAEWDRDYECSFVSKDATLVSAPKLLALNAYARKPRFVDKWRGRWYTDIKPNTAYGVVLDPSEGVDKNDACLQVFEMPSLRQVFEWNDNQADQTEQAKMLMRTLRRIYNIQQDDPSHDGTVNIYYSVERNGLGNGILMAIEQEGEEKFPGWLIDSADQKGRGLWTSGVTKRRYALEFSDLIERNRILLRSNRLVSQLKTFVRKGQGYAAKPGNQDDLVMACVLMIQLLEEVRNHEPDLDDHLHVQMDDYDPNDDKHPENQPMMPMFR